ncbi:MAG: hypothetical protein QXF12_04070 [Candidatus Aenigmatarchaeota archaeon]
MLVKESSIKQDLNLTRLIILVLNKASQLFGNKFGVKVNNFTSYNDLVLYIKNTNNYKKPTSLLEGNPKYRIKLSGDNFILLGKHGYSKKLNLLLGFDYYIQSKPSYYFQVIIPGDTSENSELAFIDNYYRLSKEYFDLFLEYESHKKKLLDGIHVNNKNNIKIYFENYSKLLEEISNNGEYQIYKYKHEFSYGMVLEYYQNYQNMLCDQNVIVNKKHYRNFMLNTTLPDHFRIFHKNQYSIITKERICTSFISIKENSYQITFNKREPVLSKIYEQKQMYIVCDETSLVITDRILTNRNKQVKTIHLEQLINKLIDLDKNIFESQKQKFYNYISKTEENSYFIYTENRIREKEKTHIEQNVYVYTLLENKKISVYDNNLKLYSKFEGVFTLYKIEKKHEVNEKNQYQLIDQSKIFLYNKEYIYTISGFFMFYILDTETVMNIDSFIKKQIDKNISLSSYFLYEPAKIKLTITNDKELMIMNLPGISELTLEIDDENEKYYVFSIRLLNFNSNVTLDINRSSKGSTLHYEVKEKNALFRDFMLSFYEQKTERLFNFLAQRGNGLSILFIFSIRKDKWQKIKCKKMSIVEIEGNFYYRPRFSIVYFVGGVGAYGSTSPISLTLRDKEGDTKIII